MVDLRERREALIAAARFLDAHSRPGRPAWQLALLMRYHNVPIQHTLICAALRSAEDDRVQIADQLIARLLPRYAHLAPDPFDVAEVAAAEALMGRGRSVRRIRQNLAGSGRQASTNITLNTVLWTTQLMLGDAPPLGREEARAYLIGLGLAKVTGDTSRAAHNDEIDINFMFESIADDVRSPFPEGVTREECDVAFQMLRDLRSLPGPISAFGVELDREGLRERLAAAASDPSVLGILVLHLIKMRRAGHVSELIPPVNQSDLDHVTAT